MITATIRLVVTECKRDEIVSLLRPLVEPTRVETGCVSCGLYKDLHDRDAIIWLEEWADQDALERHLRSPHYKKILTACDLSDGQPDIRFDTVVETRGMQVIENARGMNAGG